jgi:hypothetical protein
MKFFKFSPVDVSTGISVQIEKPVEGPTNPSFPSMGHVYDFGGYRYATVGTTAKADPANYIFEITQEEYDAVFEEDFNRIKSSRINAAYVQEKGIREATFGKYHQTAAVAGVYKYEQALSVLADPTADAPEVEAEAAARGVDVAVIAQRIVDNHEAFRLTEAKLAGLRGKIVDRLEGLTFDAADAVGSWKELVERTEVIGTKEPEEDTPAAAGALVEENLDVVVGYYAVELSQRWEWMNK